MSGCTQRGGGQGRGGGRTLGAARGRQTKGRGMSGLMRNVIDQVLRNMSEEERAQQVGYVTDRMIEKMDNQERVALLLAIIDRVMSNLAPPERAELAARLTAAMTGETPAPGAPQRSSAGGMAGAEFPPDEQG